MGRNGVSEVNGHKNLTSNETGSSDVRHGNVVEDDLPEYDWEDHRAHQLQALLINNLHATFQTAVKQVESCGYVQLAAGSTSRGVGEVVSNCNDGLRSLAKYFVLEMTNAVLKVRPDITTTEALHCLLTSGMDLSRACSMEIAAPPNSSGTKENDGV